MAVQAEARLHWVLGVSGQSSFTLDSLRVGVAHNSFLFFSSPGQEQAFLDLLARLFFVHSHCFFS